jgi:hypothetical protein
MGRNAQRRRVANPRNALVWLREHRREAVEAARLSLKDIKRQLRKVHPFLRGT